MVNFIKKHLFFLFFFFIVAFYYSPLLTSFKVPIPADTIIGLYHPYRDLVKSDFPNGYPFKNFLITDPVRQTYVWKELSVASLKGGELPLWNPYEMAGKPLLANFQSGVFYPLNLILFLTPFYLSWSMFIMLQSILGGIFLYLYLKNLNLDKRAVFLACISFIFSGFATAWLEWGTVLQTAIWFPLILYTTDNIISALQKEKKKFYINSFILLFALLSSFFAGHLQTFFYIFGASILYILLSLYTSGSNKVKKIIPLIIIFLIFNFISSFQLIPTLQFIKFSARAVDQNFLNSQGFFLPYSHLVQFIAPDFFGNPSTMNYWGTWNYGELVSYVGFIPLAFAISAFFIRRKKVLYFSLLFLASLIFALPTLFGRLVYIYQIPLISTAQPTRLLFLSTFSLSVLSAFGFNAYLKKRNTKRLALSLSILGFILICCWVFVLSGNLSIFKSPANVEVARRNLILPTIIASSLILVILITLKTKYEKLVNLGIILLLVFSTADLLRFSSKFNVFSPREFLYPPTKITEFLKSDNSIFRTSSSDDRILPPNFLTHYRIQSIEGYDPLYLDSYGKFIAAMERGKPDISEPYGFNRIITPANYSSDLYDFLNVKYVFSLVPIKSRKYRLILEEGETKLYENLSYLPRAFFARKIIVTGNDQESIDKIFSSNLANVAVVSREGNNSLKDRAYQVGEVEIVSYGENKIVLKTKNLKEGFLVISDVYYPSWHAKIDGIESRILRTNLAFRGLVVPAGIHQITFYTELF